MREILRGEFDEFVRPATAARMLGLRKVEHGKVARYMDDVRFFEVAGARFYHRGDIARARKLRDARPGES